MILVLKKFENYLKISKIIGGNTDIIFIADSKIDFSSVQISWKSIINFINSI